MIRRPIKLLVLTSTFPRWKGDTSPRFVADLCAGLGRTMEVTVLAPASPGALPVEWCEGYTVVRFRYGWPASTQRLAEGAIMPNIRRNPLLIVQILPFVLAQLWSASRLMRQQKFDAVHAHWAVPQGVVATLLKRFFGVPIITTTHGGDIYALRSAPMRWAKRWVLRSSDRVTAVSSHLRQELLGLGVEDARLRVLPMGVDTSRFAPERASRALRQALTQNGPLLLFVGRLVEKKGARYAIEAMPQIVRAYPAARLAVVGDGPERGALEQLSHRLGVADSVTFIGAIPNDDLPVYYASADVFVGPSVVEASGDTEAFGVVFAEAMASGCSVIATNVGGISDVTGAGEYAALVPQRDATALADAVCALLGNPTARSRVRERGIVEMRRKFDHRVIHESYAQLISSVAA